MHILVVDDSVIVRTVVKQQLLNVNKEFKIAEAGNGREAWEKMIKGNFMPDLCLLDVHMPEENGIELAKKMRKFPALANCLILFISFDAHRDIIMQVKELGPIGYLIKPYTTEKLRLYLDRAEELKKKNEQNQESVIIYSPDRVKNEFHLEIDQYVNLVEMLMEKVETVRDKIQILWNEKNFSKIEALINSDLKALSSECITLGIKEYGQLIEQMLDEKIWEKDMPLFLHMLSIASIRVQSACDRLLPHEEAPVDNSSLLTNELNEIDNLDLLLPNMILDQDLRDPNGLLILPQGLVLKEKTIRKIKEYYGAQLISQTIKIKRAS